MPGLSIIIPTLNEADDINNTLLPLQALRRQGHEVIVADGGSHDQTTALASRLADQLINAPRGRAIQMNTGAQHANGEVLLFLHADTTLPADAVALISDALVDTSWGRFDVKLSGHHPLLRVIEYMMNWRSRLSGIATGDQAMFVRHDLFTTIGGFADIALMEDIDISKRLKRHGRPACIKATVTTSSRRWEQQGILKTILLMWRLRLAYFLGAKPEQLSKHYH